MLFRSHAPVYDTMSVEQNKIILSFSHLSQKHAWSDPNSFKAFGEKDILQPKGFEIAGKDKKFYNAEARYIWWENMIEVYSDSVKEPVAVRYAFRNYCPEANVRTTMNQPLIPFRTDNWEIDDIGSIR